MDEYDRILAARSLRPLHINTFALPEDTNVKLAYAVYNPADEVLLLESEKERTVYAEAFITDPRLGTLSDLCVRTLAREYGLEGLAISANDPLKRRLQFDSINIDEPLERIYEIDDKKFWKRVALGKTTDGALKLKDSNYDWKSKGVTLKFVDLVENCPAEYWPELEMCNLAEKIKDHVIDMHIRKLQPLRESSFSHYCGRDSDTDKTTSTNVSDTTVEDEPEPPTPEEELESNENTTADRKSIRSHSSGSSRRRSLWSLLDGRQSEDDEDSILEASRLIAKVEKQTEIRREDRRKRRESQYKRRKFREEKRLKRDEERNRPKPRRIKVRNVFDLPIDEPEDDENKRLDTRNLKSYLKSKKKNIYKPDQCHHINLSFLSHFDNLVSFHIEFQPPPLKAKYHARYFNFSSEDVNRLACGIATLQNLRVFRLRNSRMNEDKLKSLVFALNKLKVEVVDFGNDYLTDDCEMAIWELFKNTTTIKSLELEGNDLGVNSMNALGRALKRYSGKLEYLGLARNPISSEGLHALTSKIAYTCQIKSLCLAGIRITDVAMLCCIGEELLHRHKYLRSLDIMGSPLSTRSGEHLINCMRINYNVLTLECRGCNLNESVELDIEVCLQRNRYKRKHKFIGNAAMTESDINEYVKKIRNPILLEVNERLQKKQACMDERPEIANIYSSSIRPSSASSSPLVSNDYSINYFRSLKPSTRAFDEALEHPNSVEESTEENQLSFVYNTMNFDEQQLIEHVDLPGPANRYYYFKSKRNIPCEQIE